MGRAFGKQRAAVEGGVAELLFDPKKLVVFGHAIAARRAAGFDLASVHGDG